MLPAGLSLGTELSLVHGAPLEGLDAHERIALDDEVEAATHPAVRAGRRHILQFF